MSENNTSAFAFFTKLSYGCISESAIRSRYGQAVSLSPEALARFGQIAGWLTGLSHAGKGELAAKLADDFEAALRYTLAPCESEDIEVFSQYSGNAVGTLTGVSRCRVMLYDDGTFGGFRVCWYRRITNAERLSVARSLDEEAYSSCDLPEDESRTRWQAALEKADEKLRLRKELTEFRYYRPTWAIEGEYTTCSELVHYGFSHNGGLIYHGPGGAEVLAVNLTDVRGWSLHT